MNRTDLLIENETREVEGAEIFFVEPPLNGFPDNGEDGVGFIDAVKDPLELQYDFIASENLVTQSTQFF